MFDIDPFENIQLHSVSKLQFPINKRDSSNQTNAIIFFWSEFQNIIFLDNETANCDIGFPSMNSIIRIRCLHPPIFNLTVAVYIYFDLLRILA